MKTSFSILRPTILKRMWWFCAVCCICAASTEPFVVGSFEGLTPGKSKKKEVLAKLGNPDKVFVNEDGNEVFYFEQTNKRKLAIEVWFSRRGNTPLSIFVKFANRVDRGEVERQFGLHFVWKNYNRDECNVSRGGSSYYEVSGQGQVQMLEDRARGVIAHTIGTAIHTLEFSDRPFGEPKSSCGSSRRQ